MNSDQEEFLEISSTPFPSFANHLFASEFVPCRVRVSAQTHIGYQRTRNEDHYAVLRRSRSCQLLLTNLPPDSLQLAEDEGYLLLVADGMGGGACGDYASQLAITTVLELASRSTTWIMKFTESERRALKYRVDAYLERLQERFREYSMRVPACRGMGTTMTAAHLVPPHLSIMHVGDSRAYLFRDRQLTQLTHDQTVAQKMLDAGADPKEAQRFAHLLTNSLGGDVGPVDVQIMHVDVRIGDRILVCTDGLSDYVEASQLVGRLGGEDLDEVVESLVTTALAAGGKDNITAVMAELQPLPSCHSE